MDKSLVLSRRVYSLGNRSIKKKELKFPGPGTDDQHHYFISTKRISEGKHDGLMETNVN